MNRTKMKKTAKITDTTYVCLAHAVNIINNRDEDRLRIIRLTRKMPGCITKNIYCKTNCLNFLKQTKGMTIVSKQASGVNKIKQAHSQLIYSLKLGYNIASYITGLTSHH